MSNGVSNPNEAFRLLEAGDELTVDNARLSLAALTREIASSIGFFEGRREENITRVYVSGGGARLKSLVSILSAELHIPCEAWDPFKTCEIALPAGRKETLADDLVSLSVACGAAAEAPEIAPCRYILISIMRCSARIALASTTHCVLECLRFWLFPLGSSQITLSFSNAPIR